MGPARRVVVVGAAVVVLLLQGCVLAEGSPNYPKVSLKTAEDIADNANCLSQAAYSVTAHISFVSYVTQYIAPLQVDSEAVP